MEIQCPGGGTNVLVGGSGSGSGSCSGWTICVSGTTTDQDDGTGLPMMVRVRVLSGHISPPLPPPDPKQPCDVDVPPVGQQWCAHGVPVPGSTGVPITVIAWLQTGTSWGAANSVWCNAGGSGAIDCCAGCDPTVRTAGAAAFQAWPPPPPPLPSNITGQ